jgi:hypothetical protein
MKRPAAPLPPAESHPSTLPVKEKNPSPERIDPVSKVNVDMDEWRRLINLGIALVALVAIGLLVTVAWMNRFDPVLSDLVVAHFAAIIGLPFAFIAAFVVVALFRQGEKPVEFNGFGLHLKGAAGEIILWILCFVAITGGIALLWKK